MSIQSMVSHQSIQEVIEIARNSQYTNLASLTVLVFDWTLTLPSEMSLIWGSKWSGITALYFLTRYLPFVYLCANTRYIFNHDLSASDCKVLYNAVNVLFWTSILLAQLILTIRTWVIWGKRDRIAYGIFGLFAAIWITIMTLNSFHLIGTLHGPGETYSNACNANTQKSKRCLAAGLTLLVLYETVMLILMVVRGVSSYWPMGRSHLLKTIYRDGIRFYVYLFALGVTNLILIFRLPEYMTISLMLEGAFYSVLCCRVVLHIRQDFNDSYEIDSQSEETTLGTVDIEQPSSAFIHVT